MRNKYKYSVLFSSKSPVGMVIYDSIYEVPYRDKIVVWLEWFNLFTFYLTCRYNLTIFIVEIIAMSLKDYKHIIFYHPMRRIKEILLIIRCQFDRRSLKVALLRFSLQLHAASYA